MGDEPSPGELAAPSGGRSETFTGRSLEEMTLAQKLCELREDRLRVLGLEQNFGANLRTFGLGFALDCWLERRKLARAGRLAGVLADTSRQIDDDVAAIEADSAARGEGGYRGTPLARDVARVIERFGKESDPHALGDLRRYVALHREELAREIRALRLAERHPHPGFGRLAGRLRNALSDHRASVLIVGSALLLGFVGWLAAYGVVQHRNRTRPTLLLAEGLQTQHPGVLAAAWGHDAAASANRLVNVFLGAELGADAGALLPLHELAVARAERAALAARDARSHYARGRPLGAALASGGRGVLASWTHTTDEHGHTEQTCTTSKDSNGKETESCTSRYECDYIDHTWLARPELASKAAGALAELAPKISSALPAYAVPTALRDDAQRHLRASADFARAPPPRQAELLEQVDDWLGSRPIVDSDGLSDALRFFRDGFSSSGSLRWLADNAKNPSVFPVETRQRDHTCGDGSPPAAYVRSFAVGTEAEHLDQAQTSLLERLATAASLSQELARAVSGVTEGLRAGKRPAAFADQYELLGELSLRLQQALNPKSRYAPLSRGWRVAAPLLALAGGLVAGALGAWLLLRTVLRLRYDRRMMRRGLS